LLGLASISLEVDLTDLTQCHCLHWSWYSLYAGAYPDAHWLRDISSLPTGSWKVSSMSNLSLIAVQIRIINLVLVSLCCYFAHVLVFDFYFAFLTYLFQNCFDHGAVQLQRTTRIGSQTHSQTHPPLPELSPPFVKPRTRRREPKPIVPSNLMTANPCVALITTNPVTTRTSRNHLSQKLTQW